MDDLIEWLRAEAEAAERENTARGGSVAAMRIGTRELLRLLAVCEAAQAWRTAVEAFRATLGGPTFTVSGQGVINAGQGVINAEHDLLCRAGCAGWRWRWRVRRSGCGGDGSPSTP